ncbi:MAG: M48 family metalloprotease [Abditibacteriota bacterium]|nr:M48 family metalloprotease [Abditibacteriota bacterium]MBP5738544.1 M48 family metalloprotease [Abditibacteriota bacterium]
MKRLALILAVTVMTSCAVFADTSLENELKKGKETDQEIMQQYRLSADKTAAAEFVTMGSKLAKNVSRKEIEYKFKLLRADEFNAYSVPGGYVYFTDKLWYAMTPAERAGVIGHEITHCDKKHALKAYSKQRTRQILIGIGSVLGHISSLGTNLLFAGEKLYSLKYSRENEEDADKGGTDLCIAAGEDIASVYRSMIKLARIKENAGGKESSTILSTHPKTADRVEYLKKYITDKGGTVPEDKYGTIECKFPKAGVVSAETKNNVTITLEKDSKVAAGDTLWVMRDGWDINYENKMKIPSLRAVVKSVADSKAECDVYVVNTAEMNKDNMACVVTAPAYGSLKESVVYKGCDIDKLTVPQKDFARYNIKANVWNKGNTAIETKVVGCVTLTPDGPVDYVKGEYTYAAENSTLPVTLMKDDNESRFVGVVSKFGSKKDIKVRVKGTPDKDAVYEMVLPGSEPYADRVICTARLKTAGSTSVFEIAEVMPGHSSLPVGSFLYKKADK